MRKASKGYRGRNLITSHPDGRFAGKQGKELSARHLDGHFVGIQGKDPMYRQHNHLSISNPSTFILPPS